MDIVFVTCVLLRIFGIRVIVLVVVVILLIINFTLIFFLIRWFWFFFFDDFMEVILKCFCCFERFFFVVVVVILEIAAYCYTVYSRICSYWRRLRFVKFREMHLLLSNFVVHCCRSVIIMLIYFDLFLQKNLNGPVRNNITYCALESIWNRQFCMIQSVLF